MDQSLCPGAEISHPKLCLWKTKGSQWDSRDWKTGPHSLVESLCKQMARLPSQTHTHDWNALSCHKCTELTIHAHVHSTPPTSTPLSLTENMLRNGHNLTRSPSRLKSLRQSFLRSRNAYQFHFNYLSFSDSFWGNLEASVWSTTNGKLHRIHSFT